MGNRSFSSRVVEMAPGPVHSSEPLGCLKVPFGTEADAGRVGGPHGQTAYRCPECRRWHLTKHAKFRWNDRGRRR